MGIRSQGSWLGAREGAPLSPCFLLFLMSPPQSSQKSAHPCQAHSQPPGPFPYLLRQRHFPRNATSPTTSPQDSADNQAQRRNTATGLTGKSGGTACDRSSTGEHSGIHVSAQDRGPKDRALCTQAPRAGPQHREIPRAPPGANPEHYQARPQTEGTRGQHLPVVRRRRRARESRVAVSKPFSATPVLPHPQP